MKIDFTRTASRTGPEPASAQAAALKRRNPQRGCAPAPMARDAGSPRLGAIPRRAHARTAPPPHTVGKRLVRAAPCRGDCRIRVPAHAPGRCPARRHGSARRARVVRLGGICGRPNDTEDDMNTTPTRPILVCYDGSDGARRAIETAGSLFGGRKAIVLNVWSPISVMVAAYGGMAALPSYDDDVLQDGATKVATAGSALASDAGLKAQPEIAEVTYQ